MVVVLLLGHVGILGGLEVSEDFGWPLQMTSALTVVAFMREAYHFWCLVLFGNGTS